MTQESGEVAHYLFVISRDIGADPSALFTIRSALALGRRREEVAVFLIDDACESVLRAAGAAVLARLVEAGVEVCTDDATLERLARVSNVRGVKRGSADDLGARMLQPSVNTLWC